MWIALGILAAVITIVLLLPVKLIIKNDVDAPLTLHFKVLGMTFGGEPKPHSPADKTLKKAGSKESTLKDRVRTDGLRKTVTETYDFLVALIKIALKLLKRCVITRLHIQIRCAGSDAAQTAIHYGQYCAATHGLLTALRALLTVRQRGCHIDIGCDFISEKNLFRYDVEISVRSCHILAAAVRLLFSENFRKLVMEKPQQS